MNHSNNSSKTSFLNKFWIFIFLAAALVGFLDATYLTASHYLGSGVSCSIISGCEEVLTSKYATLFEIPISLFGAVYYLTVLLSGLLYLDTKRVEFFNFALILAGAGALVSTFLLYLQAFVIKSVCIYCLTSAASSYTLFVSGLLEKSPLSKS